MLEKFFRNLISRCINCVRMSCKHIFISNSTFHLSLELLTKIGKMKLVAFGCFLYEIKSIGNFQRSGAEKLLNFCPKSQAEAKQTKLLKKRCISNNFSCI